MNLSCILENSTNASPLNAWLLGCCSLGHVQHFCWVDAKALNFAFIWPHHFLASLDYLDVSWQTEAAPACTGHSVLAVVVTMVLTAFNRITNKPLLCSFGLIQHHHHLHPAVSISCVSWPSLALPPSSLLHSPTPRHTYKSTFIQCVFYFPDFWLKLIFLPLKWNFHNN